MANIKQSLEQLLTIDGAMAACVVDSNSGMMLGSAGGGIDLDIAAAGNTEVVRAKMKTMEALNLNEEITDILVTLGRQYHIIRPLPQQIGLFIYLVLNKAQANLAMARLMVQNVGVALVMK